MDVNGAGAQLATTEHFIYDNDDDIALQFDDAGSLAHRYLHGPGTDQVLADEDASGQVLWTLTDHQGSVRDLIDSTGTVLNHIVYDSFGNITSESDSTVEHQYSYTGREYDADAELYYYRARYYDAHVGRFISEDPIDFNAGDTNLYRYVSNSPLNAVDPHGLEATEPTQGIFSSIFSAIGNAVSSFVETIGDVLSSAYDVVKDVASSIVDTAAQAVNSIIEFFKPPTKDVSKSPPQPEVSKASDSHFIPENVSTRSLDTSESSIKESDYLDHFVQDSHGPYDAPSIGPQYEPTKQLSGEEIGPHSPLKALATKFSTGLATNVAPMVIKGAMQSRYLKYAHDFKQFTHTGYGIVKAGVKGFRTKAAYLSAARLAGKSALHLRIASLASRASNWWLLGELAFNVAKTTKLTTEVMSAQLRISKQEWYQDKLLFRKVAPSVGWSAGGTCNERANACFVP